LLWALALYRAWQLIPSVAPNFAPLHFYLPVTIAWHSIGQRDEKRVEQQLAVFLSEK
jgi:hypothetical protein